MNLRSILTLRCPVCGRGKLFKTLLDTPEQCPECKYYFMRESGYYLPHFPIAYLATAGAALGTWPLLKYVVGVKSDNVILAAMILVGLLFGMWFIRYAKMIWLNIDLTFHPPSREDFEQRNRNKS